MNLTIKVTQHENGKFTASVNEYKALVVQGDSIEDVLENVAISIKVKQEFDLMNK